MSVLEFAPLHLGPPIPRAVLDLAMSDGAIVRVRRHGNPDGPRLILSHGNGFAIDGYFAFWRHLLADFELFVFDQRNHGWNPRHEASGHTQAQMANDLETIRRSIEARFGSRPTAGLFHSLSSIVSLLHASQYGFRWTALVLVDPPVAPPAGHPLHSLAQHFELTLSKWARQRRSTFDASDKLALHFKSTRRMRNWVPGVAEGMARAVTRPACGGGVELVCPPEFEAEIYLQNSTSRAWSALAAFAQQLFIVSSDDSIPAADPPGTVCKAASDEFGIAVVPVSDSGHFVQIEQPEKVETIVREHLYACGMAPSLAR